jgi:uncharacterized protein
MRLKLKDVEFIKQTARDYFGKEAKIYLFGSRVSDHKKGGDIDLYIETNSKDWLFDKKVKMLKALYKKLGEQKIDVVINNFTSSLYIYEVAQQEGILLWKEMRSFLPLLLKNAGSISYGWIMLIIG